MKIYLVTDLFNPNNKWAYTSITACLNHFDNPLCISNRRWSQIVNERGYPFQHSGCNVELLHAMTGREVKKDNPPILEEE